MLTFEQVEAMDQSQLEQELIRVNKNKDLDRSLIKHTHLLESADNLANELLWLEDRIRYLQQVENAIKANQIKIARKHADEDTSD